MFVVNVGSYGITLTPEGEGLACSLLRVYPQPVKVFEIVIRSKSQLWEIFYLIWCSSDDGDGVTGIVFDVDGREWQYAHNLRGLYEIFADKLAE